jgi:thermostable 8-oxoguanine DNA glycosylase
MNIIWEIGEPDIIKVKDFVNAHNNPFVENRINRNVNRIAIQIDRDAIIKTMLMCLLTSQQDSNADSNFEVFFRKKPFLLTYEFLSKATKIEVVLDHVLKINGLTKHSNKITNYFTSNFSFLEGTNWALQTKLENSLKNESTKQSERDLADNVDKTFKGFGSKQARNFLQTLGLTKYEIPIDSRMMHWMKDFDFPIKFSPTALQDRAFYHFISDGIQLLCEKANIYPCILDAVIFSSNGNITWTKNNIIF